MKFLPEQKLEIPTLNNAGTYINKQNFTDKYEEYD